MPSRYVIWYLCAIIVIQAELVQAQFAGQTPTYIVWAPNTTLAVGHPQFGDTDSFVSAILSSDWVAFESDGTKCASEEHQYAVQGTAYNLRKYQGGLWVESEDTGRLASYVPDSCLETASGQATYSRTLVNNGQTMTGNDDGSITVTIAPGASADFYILQDHCYNFPCQNDGDCITTLDGSGYSCTCPEGFFGDTCALTDLCSTDICLNDGVCIMDMVNGSVSCLCSENFCGEFCEQARLSIASGAYDKKADALLCSMSQAFIELDAIAAEGEVMTEYRWTYSGSGGNGTLLSPVYYGNGTSRTLRVPPSIFGYGVFTMTVTLPGATATTSAYINIAQSDLVAMIDGGTFISYGESNDVTLDAAARSYDPDNPGNLTGLMFSWSCLEGTDTSAYPRVAFPEDSCANMTFLYEIANTTVVFNAAYLEPGKYTFRLMMSDGANRTTFYDQIIEILPGFVPELRIRCIMNCNLFVVPANVLSMEIDCPQCYGLQGKQYDWRFFHDPTNNDSFYEIPMEDLPLAVSSSNSNTSVQEAFVLRAGSLNGGQHYRVQLGFDCETCTASTAQYEFYTNLPPGGGNCSISPGSGIEMVTYFTITCNDWASAEIPNRPYTPVPLYYRVQAYPPVYPSGQILYFGSQSSTTPMMLSKGSPADDFNLTLTIEVSDIYGSKVTVEIHAEVTQLGTNGTDIAAVLGSTTSSLASLTSAKEAAQVIQSLASVINTDTVAQGSSQDSGPVNVAEIRTAMVDQIATLSTSLTSVDDVTQLAQALQTTTHATTGLTSNAIESSTSVLTSFAGAAQNLLTTRPEETPSVAGAVLGATWNVLDASQPTIYIPSTIPLDQAEQLQDEADATNLSPQEQLYAASLAEDGLERARLTEERFTASMSDDIAEVQGTVGGLVRDVIATGQDVINVDTPRGSMAVQQKRSTDFKNSQLAIGGSSVALGDDFGAHNGSEQAIALTGSSYTSNPLAFGNNNMDIGGGVTNLTFTNNKGEAVDVSGDVTVQMSPGSITQDTVDTNLARNNQTGMTYHKVNVTSAQSTIILGVTPPDPDVIYDVYFKATPCCPTETSYAYHTTARVTSGGRADIVIPNDYISGVGVHHIALKPRLEEASRRRRRSVPADAVDGDYSIGMAQTQCMGWDPDAQQWVPSGTVVPGSSSLTTTTCKVQPTPKNSVFGCSFITPPNLIDFSAVWANFANLSDNPGVFSTIVCFLGIWVIVLIVTNRQDRKDEALWVVETIEDSVEETSPDQAIYKYIITVHTGLSRGAGTDSQVWFTLYGKCGDTGVRRLGGELLQMFPTASSRMFVLRLDESLGPLRMLRVWHDNKGKKNPGWQLDSITIDDQDQGIRSVFMCQQWLSAGKDDGLTDRLIRIAKIEDVTRFKHIFSTNSRSQITDNHLLLSVFLRPYRSRFTRAQRVTCVFSALFMSMIVSCMFFKTEDDVETPYSVSIGPLTFTLQQLWVSMVSAVIAIPPNIFIVHAFRKVRPSKKEIANMALLDPVDNPPEAKQRRKVPKSADSKKKVNSDDDEVSQADSGVEEGCNSPVGSQTSGLDLDASKRDISGISQKEIHTIMYTNKVRLETTGVGVGMSNTTSPTPAEQWQRCDSSTSGTLDIWGGQPTGLRSRCGSDASQKSKCSIIVVESARRGSMMSYDNTASALTVDDANPPKKGSCCNRDGLGWPRFLLPVAWVVAVGAIVVPGFFVILYSMDWGAKTSNDWLMTFFLSSFESVALFDPIKVVLVAFMVALLMYMRRDDVKTYEDDDEEDEAIREALEKKDTEDQEELRRRLQLEARATSTMKDLIAILGLLVVAVSFTFSSHDSNTHGVHSTLQGLFVDGFKSISSSRGLFHYLRQSFIPNYFVTDDYNDNDLYWRERLYLADRASYRIGPARLRQLRINTDACVLDPYNFTQLTDIPCIPGYATGGEDKLTYGLRVNRTGSTLAYPTWDAWQYTPSSDIQGMTFWGNLAVYSGGGFVAKLDINRNISLQIINELEEQSWIDRQTRAVFLEFSIYNPSVGLFGYITMLLEFPSSAGVLQYSMTQVMKAYSLDASTMFFFFCWLIIGIYFFGFLIVNVRAIKRQGKAYFGVLEHYSNWLIILTILMMVVFFALRQVTQNEVLSVLRDNPNTFIQFRLAMDYDDMFKYSVAFLNILAMIKGVLFMKLQERVSQLITTIRLSVSPTMNFMLVYIGTSIAFGCFFYFWYITSVYENRDFLRSQENLLTAALGAFDMTSMLQYDYITTAIMFTLYLVFTNWVLISILITILMDLHYEVQEDVTLQPDDHLLVNAFIKKMIRGAAKAKDVSGN